MDFLITHWSFFVVSLVLMMVGQFMKGSVFTKKRIEARKGTAVGAFLSWSRKTLPLHPVVVGALVSFIPDMPAPPAMDTQTELTIYFVGAGVCSTWIFSLLKTFAKKQGYELKAPGESLAPPPSESK